MVSSLADALPPQQEGVNVQTGSLRGGQLGGGCGRARLGNAHSAAEGVAVDAVTLLFELVVDGEGGTNGHTVETQILNTLYDVTNTHTPMGQ